MNIKQFINSSTFESIKYNAWHPPYRLKHSADTNYKVITDLQLLARKQKILCCKI